MWAAGSDDNTCRIWTPSGQCLQTLEHVGCIWGLGFTVPLAGAAVSHDNADLITACSDSVARIWTRSATRAVRAFASASLAV
jgi:phospholipase A-2-activating protein